METCPIFIVEAEIKYQSIYILIIMKHFSHLEKHVIVTIVSGMKVSFLLWVKNEVFQTNSSSETIEWLEVSTSFHRNKSIWPKIWLTFNRFEVKSCNMIVLLALILLVRKETQRSVKSGYRFVGLLFEVLSILSHITGNLLKWKCRIPSASSHQEHMCIKAKVHSFSL